MGEYDHHNKMRPVISAKQVKTACPSSGVSVQAPPLPSDHWQPVAKLFEQLKKELSLEEATQAEILQKCIKHLKSNSSQMLQMKVDTDSHKITNIITNIGQGNTKQQHCETSDQKQSLPTSSCSSVDKDSSAQSPASAESDISENYLLSTISPDSNEASFLELEEDLIPDWSKDLEEQLPFAQAPVQQEKPVKRDSVASYSRHTTEPPLQELTQTECIAKPPSIDYPPVDPQKVFLSAPIPSTSNDSLPAQNPEPQMLIEETTPNPEFQRVVPFGNQLEPASGLQMVNGNVTPLMETVTIQKTTSSDQQITAINAAINNPLNAPENDNAPNSNNLLQSINVLKQALMQKQEKNNNLAIQVINLKVMQDRLLKKLADSENIIRRIRNQTSHPAQASASSSITPAGQKTDTALPVSLKQVVSSLACELELPECPESSSFSSLRMKTALNMSLAIVRDYKMKDYPVFQQVRKGMKAFLMKQDANSILSLIAKKGQEMKAIREFLEDSRPLLEQIDNEGRDCFQALNTMTRELSDKLEIAKSFPAYTLPPDSIEQINILKDYHEKVEKLQKERAVLSQRALDKLAERYQALLVESKVYEASL